MDNFFWLSLWCTFVTNYICTWICYDIKYPYTPKISCLVLGTSKCYIFCASLDKSTCMYTKWVQLCLFSYQKRKRRTRTYVWTCEDSCMYVCMSSTIYDIISGDDIWWRLLDKYWWWQIWHGKSYIPLTINGQLSHMHGVLKLIFKKKKKTLSEDQYLPSLLRKFEVYLTWKYHEIHWWFLHSVPCEFVIWNFWLGRLGCWRLIQQTEKESCWRFNIN